MKVKQQLVPDALARKCTYGKGNPKRYITVHQTGNPAIGANAQSHANLQSRGWEASWHWQVDDTEAIQSFTHDWRCWHAGDRRGKGNTESIGIEMCINADGNYRKAVENGARLVAKIMRDEGIPIDRVVQHNHWYDKNCPAQLRAGKDGITWQKFIQMVQQFYGGRSTGSSAGADASLSPGMYEIVPTSLVLRKAPPPNKVRTMKSGEHVRVIETKRIGNQIWARTAEGWFCAQDPGKAPYIRKVSTDTVKIPSSGTFRTSKSLPVKPKADQSSATVTSYGKNETIHYDQAFDKTGYTWISYIGQSSGKRRYVAIRESGSSTLWGTIE